MHWIFVPWWQSMIETGSAIGLYEFLQWAALKVVDKFGKAGE